jgi:hypothetical protein
MRAGTDNAEKLGTNLPSNRGRVFNTANLVVEPKAELDGDLPVVDLIILDVSAGLDDLKPMNIVQRLSGLGNCILDGILNTGFRRPR